MKRRKCLTILGAVIAGPLVARTQRPLLQGIPFPHPYNKWCANYLERLDISGLADSKTGMVSFWFSDCEYFDLSTAEGRIVALKVGRKSRWTS